MRRIAAIAAAKAAAALSQRLRVGGGTALPGLLAERIDPEAAARVHTPIGLDIGAETPEEIAVAIMAEVIQVRRRRAGTGSGRPLREVKGPRRSTGAP